MSDHQMIWFCPVHEMRFRKPGKCPGCAAEEVARHVPLVDRSCALLDGRCDCLRQPGRLHPECQRHTRHAHRVMTVAEGFATLDDPDEPVCSTCRQPEHRRPSWACSGVPDERCAEALRKRRPNPILQCIITAKEFRDAKVPTGGGWDVPARVVHPDGRKILA